MCACTRWQNMTHTHTHPHTRSRLTTDKDNGGGGGGYGDRTSSGHDDVVEYLLGWAFVVRSSTTTSSTHTCCMMGGQHVTLEGLNQLCVVRAATTALFAAPARIQ